MVALTSCANQNKPNDQRDTSTNTHPDLSTGGALPTTSTTGAITAMTSPNTGIDSDEDVTSTSSSTSFETPTYSPEPSNLDYSVLLENPSDIAQSNVALTYGQVFLQGDVPADSSLHGQVNGAPIALQVDKKSTHPDGSLRHAVISAVIPAIAPNETLVLNTPAYRGETQKTPAQLSALLATNFDAKVRLSVQHRLDPAQPQEEGNIGQTAYEISARDLLSARTPDAWLAGPVVTEWMVSGALLRASDGTEHPHLSARFHVRFYPSVGHYRVDVVIENNWAFADKPQNIYYDAVIEIDGQEAYRIDNLPHFKHSRWRKTFWAHDYPEIHLKHRPEVLIATKAVPHYDPRLIGNLSPKILEGQKKAWSDEVKDQCAHFKGGAKPCSDDLPDEVRRYSLSRTQPMGKGLVYFTGMASPGDTDMLGPLPTWSAAYVLDQHPFTKKAMLGTGDLGGTWGIHYRDRTTDLPLSLLDHRRATIDERFASANTLLPRCTSSFAEDSKECALAYKPDTAHQPSFAYLPYLVTGDYYYLEEMQFWATYNGIANRPEYRSFEKGIFANFEDRGQAWTLRKLARTAAFTPDDHPLKGYFNSMLDANLEHYTATYVTNPPTDFGSLLSRIYPRSSPWMDDFFTWAIQMTANLGYKKAEPLARWKGNFPVMRMGMGSAADNDFCYIFAAAYHLRIGPGTGLDDMEQFGMYRTIAEVYEASNGKDIHPSENIDEVQFDDGGHACASQAMADHLERALGQMDAKTTASAGYVSILQMALASAVDAETPAAHQAWQRYLDMPSHPALAENPKYGITPRRLGSKAEP